MTAITQPRKKFQVQMITVPAIFSEGTVTLLDRYGNAICRNTCQGRIAQAPSQDAVTEAIWKLTAKTMLSRFELRHLDRNRSAWMKRADNLSASFRLRRHGHVLRGGRKHMDVYSTSSWRAASGRLATQAYNELRKFHRSPWLQWAQTVSNNQNKRVLWR